MSFNRRAKPAALNAASRPALSIIFLHLCFLKRACTSSQYIVSLRRLPQVKVTSHRWREGKHQKSGESNRGNTHPASFARHQSGTSKAGLQGQIEGYTTLLATRRC